MLASRIIDKCGRAWMAVLSVAMPSYGIRKGKNCAISRKASFHAIRQNIELGDGVVISEHASITCSNTRAQIKIGKNCYIGRFATLTTGKNGSIVIGDNCSIQDFAMVTGHGGVQIGSDTRIAAYTVIVSADHIFEDSSRLTREQGRRARPIAIGKNVWIAVAARILSGVQIGADSIVAAGAVVTKDFPDGSLIAGVPAKLLRNRTIAYPEKSDQGDVQ